MQGCINLLRFRNPFQMAVTQGLQIVRSSNIKLFTHYMDQFKNYFNWIKINNKMFDFYTFLITTHKRKKLKMKKHQTAKRIKKMRNITKPNQKK